MENSIVLTYRKQSLSLRAFSLSVVFDRKIDTIKYSKAVKTLPFARGRHAVASVT